MKKIFASVVLLTFAYGSAQVKLSDKDLNALVAISEISAGDPNANTEDFDKMVMKHRTPKLNHIVDVLVMLDGNDKALMSPKYLNRPDNEELQLWYALDAIGENMQTDNKNPRPNKEVAKEALSKKTDERWLVDNYYEQLYGGLAMLFNTEDMSSTNIDINSYKLKNDTEKAIFFICIMKPFLQRFQVLHQVKNPGKLLEFAGKLPKVNGAEYYQFTGFTFPDFEYPQPEGMASYTLTGLAQYYGSVMAHFMAAADKNDIALAKDIYFKSILFKPEYFKYSGSEAELQEVYNNSK